MEKEISSYLTGLQHIGIPTNDIEQTIAFYEKLGFQVKYRTIIENTKEKVAFLELGNLMLETYQNNQAALVNGAIDHIALNVTDIEEVYRKIKEIKCVVLDKEIQSLPFWEKGVRFFTVTGPNGEKVEFNQRL